MTALTHVSILGPSYLPEDWAAWVRSVLVRFLVPHSALRLHIGLQRGAGLLACEIALEQQILYSVYEPRHRHNTGEVFETLRNGARNVHGCAQKSAVVNSRTFREYARKVIGAGEKIVIVLRRTTPTSVYLQMALETDKPIYLIDMDRAVADWVAKK